MLPRSPAVCGICGVLATGTRFAVGKEEVTAMRETLGHRGPDDAASLHMEKRL